MSAIPAYKNINLTFQDRKDAGEKLACLLESYKISAAIVIALPSGGIPVAKPIKEKLNAEFDILVSKKIGAPLNPELAIGAVTSSGDYVLSPDIEEHGSGIVNSSYISEQISILKEHCKKREIRLKEICKCASVKSYTNKNIILVDDGTATGMTALAAIKTLKTCKPKAIIFATPVISYEASKLIGKTISKVVTLKIPKEFMAVGIHYEIFNQLSEDEIRELFN